MKRHGNGNGVTGTQIMTLREVARYLGLHVMTVYKLTREGRVPAAKIGGQWRFKRDVLDEWLERQRRQAAQPGRTGISPDLLPGLDADDDSCCLGGAWRS